jgi:hypothetical protein
VLRDQDRIETPVAVTRNLDLQRPVLGQHGLGTTAIALVAVWGRLGGAGRITEMGGLARRRGGTR